MKYRKTIKSYHKLSFFFALSISVGSTQLSIANTIDKIDHTLPLDSIGNEIINGNRFIIHKLEAKENYYQLSRLYSVPIAEIKAANKNKSLIKGQNILIPRGKATVTKAKPVTATNILPVPETPLPNTQELTEYKVGKSETLYSISRRFQVTVEAIKQLNGLTTNSIREGLILKIPKISAPEPVVVEVEETVLPEIIKENQPIDDAMFKPNRYGIHEKKERGVGLWLSSLADDGQTSLALHKTAPIGTILKIMNPMNQSVTFAKVVGKFGENEDTQGAIVVLSKSVASSIGLIDKKFQVEITYGVPLD